MNVYLKSFIISATVLVITWPHLIAGVPLAVLSFVLMYRESSES